MVKTTSPVKHFFIHTPVVHYVGRSLFPIYTVQIDEKTKIALRSKGYDEGIVKEIFEKRPYEKYFAPQSGDTVIDVGAHVGCFTVRSSRLVGKEGKVIAIEPSASNFSLLLRNIEINQLINAQALNCGLGEVSGRNELLLTRHGHSNTIFSSSSRWETIVGKETIEVKTLDQIVEELELKSVEFLKIDTEGVELGVLNGAKQTLRRFSPVIVGEAHPRISDSGQAILGYLEQAGYEGRLEPELPWNPVFHAWKEGAPKSQSEFSNIDNAAAKKFLIDK